MRPDETELSGRFESCYVSLTVFHTETITAAGRRRGQRARLWTPQTTKSGLRLRCFSVTLNSCLCWKTLSVEFKQRRVEQTPPQRCVAHRTRLTAALRMFTQQGGLDSSVPSSSEKRTEAELLHRRPQSAVCTYSCALNSFVGTTRLACEPLLLATQRPR